MKPKYDLSAYSRAIFEALEECESIHSIVEGLFQNYLAVNPDLTKV